MGNSKIYWLHALSATHVGTGRGVGYIDLPIHRDKVTGWPAIPGSAFKGVWADQFQATEEKRKTDPALRLAFGRASDRDENASNAGALMPTDARIVCLPVRSYYGTFAWCTSPLALQMLHRDLAVAGIANLPPVPANLTGSIHRTPTTRLEDGGLIFLEDLDFPGKACEVAGRWAQFLGKCLFPEAGEDSWRECFAARFAVVPDEVFDFLTQTGTEVVARVRIDGETKTVAERQLWNEESLPAETVLAGLIGCDRVYSSEPGISQEALLEKFATKPLMLQVGGKASVGRGRVRCLFTSGEETR